MLVCSHCAHENPISAVRCEACFSVLPMLTHCFNCGAQVQTGARFCGQCGTALRLNPSETIAQPFTPEQPLEHHADVMVIPDLVPPQPLVMLDSVVLDGLPTAHLSEARADLEQLEDLDRLGRSGAINPIHEQIPIPVDYRDQPITSASAIPAMLLAVPDTQRPAIAHEVDTRPLIGNELIDDLTGKQLRLQEPISGNKTKLQERAVYFVHLPSNTAIEIPAGLPVVHIGKPNDRVPPDIDIAGFPHSEVVSRIHADLRVEGDAFFLEDVGSANGTYVNNLPLLPGNRHRLRVGDRIAFGKGNLVTFLFQLI